MLIESLKRLEYRGYDSWGTAIAREGQLAVQRETGPISNAPVQEEEIRTGWWGGIAHTRWATHGAPTVENAHPHTDCEAGLALVHNGIIENHATLRSGLEARGHSFRSETDTEVIAHLIEEFRQEHQEHRDAFLSALKLLHGTYGVAVVFNDCPGKIFIARNGSPMVIGTGSGETTFGNDPSALVTHTRQVVYLDDGEAAVLTADGFETYGLDAKPIDKEICHLGFSLPDIERGGHAHFMLKEIFEQPETLRNAFRGRIIRPEATARLDGIDEAVLRQAKRCHILACGTSWHAGLIGKYLLENLARVPTQVSYAAEFRYASPAVEPGTLFIAISQSGETADTLAGIHEARLHGAQVMGICNVVGSSIARECGQGVYIHAGPEIGVASTKAFTGQLAVLALLAVHMGRMRGMGLQEALRYLDALERLPDQAAETLSLAGEIREMALQYAGSSNFLYVGRLYEYPLALEGALKLKEISYVHAEGVPAAELKHGPIALIDENMPTMVLAAQHGILDKMMSNVQEIRARGGKIIAITHRGNDELERLAERVVCIPDTLDPLVPLLAVIPLQLLAYHIAVLRGCDVDRPRNLAKSVTVE